VPTFATGDLVWLPVDPRYPSEDCAGFSNRAGRFAVADGAAASREARRWARYLVEAFLKAPPHFDAAPDELYAWFAGRAAVWAATRPPIAPEDRWLFEGPGALSDSAAAFVGMQVRRRADGRLLWAAVAVGDCCLFHLRANPAVPDGPLLVLAPATRRGWAGYPTVTGGIWPTGTALSAFPIGDPDAITNQTEVAGSSPELLRALRPRKDGRPEAIRTARGSCAAGDVILLASDAVSAWLLRMAQHSPDRCLAVAMLPSRERQNLLYRSRDAGELAHDDDLTLLTVRIRSSRS
jgi:hypothetical protein